MLAVLRALFTPPVFPGDEDRTQKARRLRAALVATLAFLPAIMLANLVGGLASARLWVLVVGTFAATLGLLWLLRSGRPELAAWIWISIGTAAVTLRLLELGTIRAPTTSIYLIIIAAAGLLLDRWSVTLVAALHATIVLGAMLAERQGWLPPADFGVGITQWVTYAVIFWATGFVVSMATEATTHALERVRHELAERQRAEAQLQASAARLEALNQIGRVITNLQDVENVFETALEHTRRLLPLDTFYIGLYDAGLNQIAYPLLYDDGRRHRRERVDLPPDGWSAYVIRTRQSLVYDQGTPLPPGVRTHLLGSAGREARAALVVPLQVGARVSGVLSVQSYSLEAYSAEQVDLLNGLARQVAIAIDNAQLFEAQQRQLAVLTAMHEIGLDLSSQLDLPGLLATVMQRAAHMLGATMGGLYLMAPDGRTLLHRANLPAEKLNPPTPLGQGLVGRVAETGRPMVVDDYNLWPGRMADGMPFCAALAIPIRWQDRVLGVISICDPQPGRFGAADVEAVELLAAQAAVAIQNANLYATVRQRVGELEALNAIGQVLVSQLGLDELVETVGDKIREIFHVPIIYIALYEAATQALHFKYYFESGQRQPSVTLPFGAGMTSRVIQMREPILINRDWEQTAPHYGAYYADGRPAKCSLTVPMLVGDRPVGAISLQSLEQEDLFSEADIRLLATLADSTAVAVDHAWLYQQAQQRAAQLASLNAIGRTVSVLRDLEGVLDVIYQQVQRLLPLDAFFICLYDPARAELTYPILYDEGRRYREAPNPMTPGTVLSRVIQTGQPELILRTPAEIAEGHERMRHIGNASRSSASLAYVPLVSGERILGALSVQSYSLNAYTPDHVDLLLGVAHQAAIAVENANLYTLVQQRLQEREALIQELEAKNAELERFTYTVSHDLKSPLITIRGYLGYLERDARAGNLDRLRRDLGRIEAATDKMQRLLNELLELSRIGRMMNPPERLLFLSVVQEALGLVDGRLKARGVRVSLQPGLETPVVGDRVRLVEAVQNLLDNAAKFMGDQAEPRIEIGVRPAEPSPVFFVQDNGIGIEPAYQDKVFGLFDKLDSQTEGTGVGLALVKRIVEVHGGRIWLESEGHQTGTTFYFTLPGALPVNGTKEDLQHE